VFVHGGTRKTCYRKREAKIKILLVNEEKGKRADKREGTGAGKGRTKRSIDVSLGVWKGEGKKKLLRGAPRFGKQDMASFAVARKKLWGFTRPKKVKNRGGRKVRRSLY